MSKYGLSKEQIEESRRKYGDNTLTQPPRETFWSKLLGNFQDPIIRILIVALLVNAFFVYLGHGDWIETIGIFLAIILATFVSTWSEYSNENAFQKLQEEASRIRCKVWRDGEPLEIAIDDVVVGEAIILEAGDKIPADGILLDGTLKLDQAALNGESEEAEKTVAPAEFQWDDGKIDFLDEHKLFRGSVVVEGTAVMQAVKIGDNSVYGQLTQELKDDGRDSPLKLKLKGLAEQISKFGYAGGVLIAVAVILHKIYLAGSFAAYFADMTTVIADLVQAVILAIIIIVMAVPEGLPLMIAIVSSLNMRKMLHDHVLVRKLVGIETAGSLNLLFTDKTGTITKGMLEVVEFFMPNGNTIPMNELSLHSKIKALLDISIGKNTASMFDANHRVIGGNATDQALMKFIGEETYNVLTTESEYSVNNSQGFNSSNKFSQVEINELGKTFYKGAPEKFLSVATRALDEDGNEVELNFDEINEKINALASKAMRVLAIGYSYSQMTENTINDDGVLIGFVAIRDDVRPEAKMAIKEVIDAGIQVEKITADRLETAVSIAEDAGLIQNQSDKALTSIELNRLSDDEIKSMIKDIRVIARALPTDKSRMVRICQEMNLVVGMTGDGVNDSPALKRADVGFAMGSGTEAAKEAGKIVVLDDNFRSIKDAILYGRTIYHNILKFCKFQLVINVAAVVVSAIAPFFGVDEPLKVTHLLFVNLVMDGLGAIMLGNEPAKEKYMEEAPRRRDESIISKKMMAQILTMGTWLVVISFVFLKLPFFDQFFDTEEQKLTAYFVLFILSALFNGFNVRDEKFAIFSGLNENTGFLKVFFLIIAVQACIVNAGLVNLDIFKWIGEMFSCVPFGIIGWIVVIILGFTMIPVDLIRKLVVNNK